MESETITTAFVVPGMTCGHCQQAVTSELSKLDGVIKVDVNLETKSVSVVSACELVWEQIVEAVDEAGFEAVVS